MVTIVVEPWRAPLCRMQETRRPLGSWQYSTEAPQKRKCEPREQGHGDPPESSFVVHSTHFTKQSVRKKNFAGRGSLQTRYIQKRGGRNTFRLLTFTTHTHFYIGGGGPKTEKAHTRPNTGPHIYGEGSNVACPALAKKKNQVCQIPATLLLYLRE